MQFNNINYYSILFFSLQQIPITVIHYIALKAPEMKNRQKPHKERNLLTILVKHQIQYMDSRYLRNWDPITASATKQDGHRLYIRLRRCCL